MADVSKYLPTLLGPHSVTQDGGDAVTARPTWDFVGVDVTDDSANDKTVFTVTGGSALTAATVTWAPPTAVAGESNDSVCAYLDTPDDTPAYVEIFTHADETAADYVANVLARSEDGQHYRVDLRAAYESTGGTFSVVDAPNESNALGTNPGSWSAAITRSSSSIRVALTGDAGSPVRWVVQATRLVVKKTAVAPSFVYADFDWALDLEGDNLTAAALIGTASAGTSGSNSFDSTTANTIAAGTAMNAHDTYDNSTDAIWSFADGWELSDLVSVAKTAWTAVIVMNANAGAATGTAFYDHPYILGTGAGAAQFGISLFDDAGTVKVIAGMYDGGFKAVEKAVVVGTKTIVQVRLLSGNLQIRLNKGSWTTLGSVGAIDTVTDYMTNYSANGRADVDVARLSVSPTGIADADLDDICDYLGGLYGISV